MRLLFLLSVEWREKIGRLTQPLACSKNQHTRKKKIIIRGFSSFFKKKFFSFSYLSSWTLALASSNSRSSFKWKCVAESPKHDTPRLYLFFSFWCFVLHKLSNGSNTHTHTTAATGTWINWKMWGGPPPEHNTHESLVCCFRCACKLALACETLFFVFGGTIKSNRRYFFVCNTWAMLQPSRPAGTFKLKVYYVGSYLPSCCNGPFYLSLSLLFFFSLSFIPLYSLSKKNRAPFIVPLSSGLQTEKEKKGEPGSYMLFLFPLPKIFCTFVCSVCLCVSDVLFALSSTTQQRRNEIPVVFSTF